MTADTICFNSRAHVGRDVKARLNAGDLTVSIHAPTWGATALIVAVDQFREFQFTRPRGARRDLCRNRRKNCRFNSRAHVGRDTPPPPNWRNLTFQFTRPRGARPSDDRSILRDIRFQFTRPRGARRNVHVPLAKLCCFNSRAHVGRDSRPYEIEPGRAVSIHAPTWGATPRRLKSPPPRRFQFTRPRGARPFRPLKSSM